MKYLKKISAVVLAAATSISLAACGNGSKQAQDESDNGVVTINVWTWEPTITNVKKKFEKENPKIKVKITNAGTGVEQYKALNNSISAGKGAPDVAQVEYYAINQYVMGKSLKNLSDLGAGKYSHFYTPGPWKSVNINGGVYGLPIDSGPVALFYNKAVFDRAGVTQVPQTMDEYYEAAKKIHALGPDYFITADAADPAIAEMMLWSAGGHPFKTKGNHVSIDLLNDSGYKKYKAIWQKMIQEGLIDTKSVVWSDDWAHALNDGKLASLTRGAWMVSMLDDYAAKQAGNWRVAKNPAFTAGVKSNAEDGGSTLAILASSKKTKAAWKFIDFASHNAEGIKTRIDLGQFPSDRATLNSQAFKERTDPYFGDQKFNEVLSQSAAEVNTKWQFLPYDVYARSIYGDTAGQTVTGKVSFDQGFKGWQKQLIDYGKQQGYEMD
ncbi:extracellular solute-binding protein [Bifidobacterium sp. ESL0800]|uniref:ABC transporter substrate-binding protein n=1 Tax=Bifidobacterium sp. ESL0800 TaxID=2983236 RepID=UPI0023F8C7E5|nr:extracellular solute-binding protein [Bifidobacterium sp. ESL0800]WEV75894.1 extracellular solute-binding protein [Bifidobacterium sp. ESL0800]